MKLFLSSQAQKKFFFFIVIQREEPLNKIRTLLNYTRIVLTRCSRLHYSSDPLRRRCRSRQTSHECRVPKSRRDVTVPALAPYVHRLPLFANSVSTGRHTPTVSHIHTGGSSTCLISQVLPRGVTKWEQKDRDGVEFCRSRVVPSPKQIVLVRKKFLSA